MVKESLCLTKHHGMETYGGGGGWVGPRAELEAMEKIKIPSLHRQ
jgi:hypothetical protein